MVVSFRFFVIIFYSVHNFEYKTTHIKRDFDKTHKIECLGWEPLLNLKLIPEPMVEIEKSLEKKLTILGKTGGKSWRSKGGNKGQYGKRNHTYTFIWPHTFLFLCRLHGSFSNMAKLMSVVAIALNVIHRYIGPIFTTGPGSDLEWVHATVEIR